MLDNHFRKYLMPIRKDSCLNSKNVKDKVKNNPQKSPKAFELNEDYEICSVFILSPSLLALMDDYLLKQKY